MKLIRLKATNGLDAYVHVETINFIMECSLGTCIYFGAEERKEEEFWEGDPGGDFELITCQPASWVVAGGTPAFSLGQNKHP